MTNRKLLLPIFALLCFACDRNNGQDENVHPDFENVVISPYKDPTWHPGGEIIAFNHTPVKHSREYTGPDNRLHVEYVYDDDSTGFWFVKPDGTDKRRILPFPLLCPAWSSDGHWIAFVKGSQIFKMPFDGEKFDTTKVTQLTFQGRNFFPSWSHDGSMIAYDNTDCGSITTPAPPSSCGVLIMNSDGTSISFVAHQSRMPYWRDDKEFLYSFNIRHNLETGATEAFFDPLSSNIFFAGPPKFSWDFSMIAFVGKPVDGGFLKLYSISPDGRNLVMISSDTIEAFAWGPNNQIVYQKFDNIRIDRTNGALWIMDANGTNQKPLTFNSFFTHN